MNNSMHKCNNLDEMNLFLQGHNALKFIQGETDNLNRSVSIKGIKSTFNNLLKNKALGTHMVSLVTSTKHLRTE